MEDQVCWIGPCGGATCMLLVFIFLLFANIYLLELVSLFLLLRRFLEIVFGWFAVKLWRN
jgi:hypothetical protein